MKRTLSCYLFLFMLSSFSLNGFPQEREGLLRRSKNSNQKREETAGLETVDERGNTVLSRASCEGDLSEVQRLLSLGANPNHRNHEDETPLMLASLEDHSEVVCALLGAAVDPNAAIQEKGVTALMMASFNGNLEAIRALKPVADLNQQDFLGNSALMYAAGLGVENAAEILLELVDAGAGLGTWNGKGNTVLSVAAIEDRPDIIELLAKLGADINWPNKLGHTPLMKACGHNNPRCVEKLLDLGADLDAEDLDGKTVVALAVDMQKWDLVKKLLDGGAWPAPLYGVAMCPRCVEDFEQKDQILRYQCGHKEHKECAKFFKTNSCPLCGVAPSKSVLRKIFRYLV